MSFKKIFILLILISPFFWWQFLNNQNQILSNYSKIPNFFGNKISSITNNDQYSEEFRWNNTINTPSIIAKKVYYQTQSLLSEGVKYVNNLNPRFYFQSGSGQTDSPPQVEPIAIFLLPISFIGIFKLIKKFKFKILLIALASCLLAFMTGQISFYFLFPTALFYLYAAAYEIFSWKLKYQKIFLSLLIIYSLFLFLRVNFIFNL
ncbi:MAG: hypothetical protein WDA13_00315 [Candidatus Shapirobacteria bacterium]